MGTERRVVLVTGASGVIGRAVAEALDSEYVLGLVHSETDVDEVDECVHGDLSRPRLGLDESTWEQLARRVDVIVHSGALTAWGRPREEYAGINIEGTRQVIELARRAGASIHYLSSSFVHALETDRRGAVSDDNVVLPYIESKLVCEELIAAAGRPYTIHRITNLVGDSRTGASSRPQIVQAMSQFVGRGKAPYFPLHDGNLIDFVPLDVTAQAVVRVLRAGDEEGRTYWLTYGADAMSVDDAQQILIDHARDQGRELEPVPVADPTGTLPVAVADLPATLRAFVKVLIDVSEVTHASGGVLPSSLRELADRHGLEIPSDRDAYRASLTYWAGERAQARVRTRGAA